MGLLSHLPISAHVAPCWCTKIFFSLMHSIGPELPISAHVACARVCRQLYVLCASHALVQATVGVGTVIFVCIGVAYTRGGVLWMGRRRCTRVPGQRADLLAPHCAAFSALYPLPPLSLHRVVQTRRPRVSALLGCFWSGRFCGSNPTENVGCRFVQAAGRVKMAGKVLV